MTVYAGYLWFQLVSHTILYADKGDHVLKSTQYAHGTRRFGLPPKKKNQDSENAYATVSPSAVGRSTTLNGSQRSAMEYAMSSLGTQVVEEPSAEGQVDDGAQEEEETPQMSLLMTIILLIAVTVVSPGFCFVNYLRVTNNIYAIPKAGSSDCRVSRGFG